MRGGGGVVWCVSLWLDKQQKERGQTNTAKWLVVSQNALSGGGKKNYKDEKISFKAFHFKRKTSSKKKNKLQSNW